MEKVFVSELNVLLLRRTKIHWGETGISVTVFFSISGWMPFKMKSNVSLEKHLLESSFIICRPDQFPPSCISDTATTTTMKFNLHLPLLQTKDKSINTLVQETFVYIITTISCGRCPGKLVVLGSPSAKIYGIRLLITFLNPEFIYLFIYLFTQL